jgi:hypothetical protein
MQKMAKEDVVDHNKEQIVFHDFFANNIEQTVQISEIGREFRDGSVKETHKHSNDFFHPVEIVFLDKSGKRIVSQFMEHPLIMEYEYADEEGALGMVTSYKDSTSFMLRYNAIEDLHRILFISINQDTLAIKEDIQIRK